MNGYQPEKKCTNCLAFNICNKKHKNKICKKYKACQPPSPPKSGSLAITPEGVTYTPSEKKRTVLSVRDFAILYNIVAREVDKLEHGVKFPLYYSKEPTAEEIEERMAELRTNPNYQDLLRIRDKLGELNIEVETPIVGVEE